ncbi:MAG: hypothetical protein NZ523_08660 [Elioraea sp.]|nr:hypothetical protein [Elioraea sp.]
MSETRPIEPRANEADPQAVEIVGRLTRAQTEELVRRRRVRNRALALVLFGLVALFFALSASRLADVGDPQKWSRPGAIAPSR